MALEPLRNLPGDRGHLCEGREQEEEAQEERRCQEAGEREEQRRQSPGEHEEQPEGQDLGDNQRHAARVHLTSLQCGVVWLLHCILLYYTLMYLTVVPVKYEKGNRILHRHYPKRTKKIPGKYWLSTEKVLTMHF